MAQALTTTAALAAKLSAVQVACRSEGAQAPHAVSMPGFSGRKVASSVTSVRGAPLVATRRTPVAAARAVSPVVAAVAAEPVTEAEASLNGVRGSALKVRRVVDQIRGRSYEEALMILEFMPYRACDHVLKCLYSAAANAKNNYGMSKSKLYVKTVTVDAGPVLKRFRPRAQGRAAPIRKPTFSVRIVVAEQDEDNSGRRPRVAASQAAAAPAAAAPPVEVEADPAPAPSDKEE